MRFAMVLAVVFVTACASEKLALAPPADVDFTGHWRLNEADSDDAMRIMQTAAHQNAPAGSGGGSRQGSGRGGGGGGGRVSGPMGPATPSVSALGEGLRWPGKNIDIKQVAGVIALSSDGNDLLCQPDTENKPRHHQSSAGRDGRSLRDGAPPNCGWEDRTLIVQGGEPDDDHPPFEERYSLSGDGKRLVEVVAFKGGRSSGFTLSRVWDKSSP